MTIRSYRDLKVWQQAMDLVEGCYRLTTAFPRDEQFGLSSQIKRAAVSIPANVAEGYGRESTGSYVNFLKISRGSLRELETHLLLVSRLQLAAPAEVEPLPEKCEQVAKMLFGLIRSLEEHNR